MTEGRRRRKSARTGVAEVDPSEAGISTSEMLTSAAIWSAVIVAGTLVVSKFKN